MHLLFVDESGTPPKPDSKIPEYFVVGGIVIPEGVWHRVQKAYFGLKVRHRIRGELKWRYFSPDNRDVRNPMRDMDHATRNIVRGDVIRIINAEISVRTISCVASAAAAYELASVRTQEDLYHGTFKPVTERFQYYLQDMSRAVGTKQFGIVIADHRGSRDDKRLRGHHQKLLHSTADHISSYGNLIEGLFLEPSNLSVGIQLADIVAGCIWRKFERDDSTWYDLIEPSIRRKPDGSVDGYGLVKFPVRNWR